VILPPTFVAPAHPARALAAAVIAFFVVTLDAVVVTVALPSISDNLDASIQGLQWVVDGYALTFAAFLLTAGALSDRLGAKRTLSIGLSAFVAASAACGLAPTLPSLVAWRLAQGVAAAAVLPSSVALVGQAYTDVKRRRRAVALWAMGGAIASTSGPLIGGLLATVDWRWIFLVNLPIGAVGLLLLAGADTSPRRAARVDWVGQLTGATCMAALTFAVIETGSSGIASAKVVGALLLSLASGLGFAASQRWGAHPMLPFTLLRTPAVGVSAVVGAAWMAGYFGLPFVMTLVLQRERGLTPLTTGLVFVPMMLTGLVLTPFVPRLLDRYGSVALIRAGFAVMALGLTVLAVAGGRLQPAAIAGVMVLVGLSGPAVSPPITAVLLHAVPASMAGTASGVFHTSRQVGGVLAVGVFGTLMAGAAGIDVGARLSLLIAAAGAAVAGVTASAVSFVPAQD
jgi:MFS family permease